MTRAAALLKDAEDAHAIVTLWRWLARRFGEARFPETELAEGEAARLADLLDRGLASMAAAAAPEKKTRERKSKGKGGAGSAASASAAKKRKAAPAASSSSSEVTFSLSEEGQGARAVVSPGSA